MMLVLLALCMCVLSCVCAFVLHSPVLGVCVCVCYPTAVFLYIIVGCVFL